MTTTSRSANCILLAEDEELLREEIAFYLEEKGYEVVKAASGREAIRIFDSQKVDLVVSDIRMPEVDGLQLTRHVKKTRPVPVVLMTGFASVLETQDAHELGADEFLAKPFERDELLNAIRFCLAQNAKSGTADASDFCAINLDDFVSGREIKFNIFIRIGRDRYVKVAHQGEDLSLDRIRTYKDRGLKALYIRRSDFRDYVGFSLNLSQAASKSAVISAPKKVNLMKHTGELVMNTLHHDGVDLDSYQCAGSFVEGVIDLLTDDSEITTLLDALNSHADHLYAHSVGVSMYAVMIARASGWTLASNLFKVSMGGLLHDIGKKELPRELLQKPRMTWNTEEVRLFESHSQRGVQLLKNIESVSDDVREVVWQHHESCNGLGFPQHLKRSAIHPMAKLVAIATEFCDRVVKNPQCEPMQPKDALREMTQFYSDALDPQFFQSLKKLFRFEPPAKKGPQSDF